LESPTLRELNYGQYIKIDSEFTENSVHCRSTI